MTKFGHPVLDAAWTELQAIYRETGGTHDPFNPNRHPEYLAAQRIWLAVVDARGPIAEERRAYRNGEKKFHVVDAAELRTSSPAKRRLSLPLRENDRK